MADTKGSDKFLPDNFDEMTEEEQHEWVQQMWENARNRELTPEEKKAVEAAPEYIELIPDMPGYDDSSLSDPEYCESVARSYDEQGLPYHAQYVRMFGTDMNPWFWGEHTAEQEEFYRQCVEEGKPWDYFVDPPPSDIML